MTGRKSSSAALCSCAEMSRGSQHGTVTFPALHLDNNVGVSWLDWRRPLVGVGREPMLAAEK